MGDLQLLAFTLRAMRAFGGDTARLVRDSRDHCSWYAGPQPLNRQAVQDLSDSGWLRKSADGMELRIDAWPRFASQQTAEEAQRG